MYNSIQKWLPIEEINKNGIIKLKNNYLIKIIEIKPTNYNLKSYSEKEAILNSYKLFLKNCDFNFQILIQSSKKDLNKYILKIQEQNKNEENNIKNISEEYIKNLKIINSQNKSDIKNFYFIINEKKEKNNEEIILNKLNEKYLKVKEFISRCGNSAEEIKEYDKIIKILKKTIYLK